MRKSIASGVLIGMAAYLFLRAEKPWGALLFGFALCFVCLFELDLFTGKIGWFGAKDLPYLKILLGNAIGVVIVCLLLRWNMGVQEEAATLVAAKVALPWYLALINGAFCGVLMFLAVYSWSKGLRAGCFLCVTVFILCGFEHSIADLAYMAYANVWTWNLAWILVGNWVGAVGCRLLMMDNAPFFSLLQTKK
ncbi:formate/nitrite transporter family protein [Allobaculum sp. JKK-2023]|uniref:formate/nitrite transporter family protein n=1 Tax=Allobaculum sp. JKK-2023 TaxID=3108943 RepID=UPI002B05D6C0|nr:formate/nitrite transporter family protein [Allobaculum sp. JKK-2023]